MSIPAGTAPAPDGHAPGGPLGIRAAVAADSGAMAEAFIEAWRQAYPGVVPDAVLAGLEQDKTARWLAGLIEQRPEGETDVAVSGGQVTGFVRYGRRAVPDGAVPDGPAPDETLGYVFGLYVHPGHAGRGTGQALLRHAEQRLRERGCARVALHVFAANERARRLYTRAGYRPDGSTRIEPEYEALEVRLVKELA
jgi:ribosomal protein S18 acetylase RimI-like enzyme